MKQKKMTYGYEGQRALAEVLFNSIGDGAITTDEYGRITRINPTAQEILGYTEEEAIGMWFPKLFIAYDEDGRVIPLIDRPLTRSFVTGSIISERIHYKTKAGDLVPMAITVSPIMVKDQPVGCIEIFRDITKEYEIDKMKSDFISLASHQLRTPLSAIKTYSHMLIDGFMGPINHSQLKSLKTIISASNRMNETISTLLNITRIESGSVAVAKKPVTITELVDEISAEYKLAARDKDIKLKIIKPKNKIKIISDVVVLKEIIGNLVSNAIKYTNSGGAVTIETKSKDMHVVVSVSDTGLGIPENSKDSVFTKFFRAENVVKQETSGTGLGLFLAKGLIKELGGEIWFDSEENKGSTFYVSLPMLPQIIKTKAVNK